MINANVLIHIAISIDKYDCSESLSFALLHWLNSADNWTSALLALIFHTQELFVKTMSALIFD
jgi:hypothetical protein